MSKLTITVVSPHSDDAALSISDSLSTLIDQGALVRVISCFTTSAWAPHLKASTPLEVISSIRHEEDKAFVAQLGPQATLYRLGLLDEPLRPISEPRGHSAHGPDSHLVKELAEALEHKGFPQGIWMIPMAVRHPDHLVALWAGLSAAGSDPVIIYEDMPYALTFNADEIFHQTHHFSTLINRPLQPATLGQFDEQRWCDRVACYASQFCATEVTGWATEIKSRGGERLWLDRQAATLLTQAISRDLWRK